MANSKKGREKRRWNSLFCCFGSSGERELVNKDEKNMKLSKYIGSSKKSSRRGKTVPISESTLITSREIVSPSKGIQVVVGAEVEKAVQKKTNKFSASYQLITSKEIVLEKSSSEKQLNTQSNATQEARSNKLSHSVSMPPTRMRKEKAAKQKNDLYGGEYLDPIVGAFIIMVTLVVMLIWGKVLAILSTTAWFYFIPRLIRTKNGNESSHAIKANNASNRINLDSPEYKKKVVLQGFLERNQHVSI